MCVKVFQVCGQPSLGARSRRAASRRNLRSGLGWGEGRRRGNRRRRTTPSLLELNDDDDDDDEMVSEDNERRRLQITGSTASISVSSTSSTYSSDSMSLNMTLTHNQTLSTIPMSLSSTGLPLVTDSRPRRTRRPRRNRNRASRRRKNQRTSTAVMSVTTEATYAGQHALWGMQHQHHHHHRDSGSVSELERLMTEIRSKLTMNRELVSQLPQTLCSTVAASVTQRRCWNGTSYSRSVLFICFVVGSATVKDSLLCQHSTLCLLYTSPSPRDS